MVASSTSSLCWKHRIWRHGMEDLGCPPTVLVAIYGWFSRVQWTSWSASPRRLLLEANQVPPSTSFRWCVDKENPFEAVVLWRCRAAVDAAFVSSLEYALYYRVVSSMVALVQLLLRLLLATNGGVLVLKYLLSIYLLLHTLARKNVCLKKNFCNSPFPSQAIQLVGTPSSASSLISVAYLTATASTKRAGHNMRVTCYTSTLYARVRSYDASHENVSNVRTI
jgi:hypothetical protein